MALAGRIAVATARPSVEMVAVVVPAAFVGSKRCMRWGRGFRRPLGHRRSRGRGWARSRSARRRGGWRWAGSGGGGRVGRAATGGSVGGRGGRDRMGDDRRIGSGDLRAGRSGPAAGAVPRPMTGGAGGLRPSAAVGRGAGMDMGPGTRCDGGVADRLFPVSQARERDTGDQRPALVERQGDHRQADRRGEAEKYERCAASADKEPITEDTRLQRL